MEIEKDKWVEIERSKNSKTEVYIPSNYLGPIAINATIYQPERSKREDQIEKHSFLGPVRRMTRPDLDAVL